MTESNDKLASSIYARVLAAAMEAKRLNSRQLISNVTPRRKVTTEAMQRLDDGEVSYVMKEMPEKPFPEDETPATELSGVESDATTSDDGTKGANDTWTH